MPAIKKFKFTCSGCTPLENKTICEIKGTDYLIPNAPIFCPWSGNAHKWKKITKKIKEKKWN